ncbi:MAG: recombinase family protein [Erysipelotrichaceae bacterium]|nr:recombinase family protein [Erysipelotrichaceae bacterium]
MKKVNRAAIYCRNSDTYGTFEPEYPHNSIAYQAGSAMALIIDKGLDFAGLYVDEDGSYTAWIELNTECARGNVDAIIVRDMAVFDPSTDFLIKVEKILPVVAIGAEDLFYTKEEFNLETFEYESHHTLEHNKAISASMQAGKKKGQSYGRTPYGYNKDDKGIDPNTADVVRTIFDLAEDGHKVSKIRDYLNETKIPTPGKSKSWSRDSVLIILNNKVYCGDEAYEQIISPEQYAYVQEILNSKKQKDPGPFPMIRCDECNSKLVYQKAGSIPRLKTSSYKCPKHGKIKEADLTRIALERCNEFLNRDYEISTETDRPERILELGERVLKGEEVSDQGLWIELLNDIDESFRSLYGGMVWKHIHHMDEYDPKVGKKLIRSMRLTADGDVKIKFWGDR